MSSPIVLDREKVESRFYVLLDDAKKKYHEQIGFAKQQLNYLNGNSGCLRADLEAFLGGADDSTLDKLLLTIEMTGIDSPEVWSFISANKDRVTDFYEIEKLVDGKSMVPGGWTNMMDYINTFIDEKLEKGIYLSRERDFMIIENVRDKLLSEHDIYDISEMFDEYLTTVTVLDTYIAKSRERQEDNRKVVSISR